MTVIQLHKKVNQVFPNLIAELARVGMSKTELAHEAGLSVSSVYYKCNGSAQWKLSDMEKISNVLEMHGAQDTSINYLFKKYD